MAVGATPVFSARVGNCTQLMSVKATRKVVMKEVTLTKNLKPSKQTLEDWRRVFRCELWYNRDRYRQLCGGIGCA